MALLKRLQNDQSLARYAGWFVPLKIETRGEEWSKWASQYRHEGRSIPIVFVVRADGQQLYGKSGPLPGLELLQMINQVLSQSGTIYSDQQLNTLQASLTRAKQASEEDDVQQAVREMSKLGKIGIPGKLGSFSEVAIEVDRLAEKLAEQGRTALAAAKAQLENEETLFDGALALAETRRTYVTLPALKDELLTELNRMRADDQLRGTLKLAEQLDEACDLARKPAGQRRALIALRRVISQNPNTRAATIAAECIREHFPDESPEASIGDFHKWVSTTGSTITAALIGYRHDETTKETFVHLRTQEGKKMEVPFAQLSAASQELAKRIVQEKRAANSED